MKTKLNFLIFLISCIAFSQSNNSSFFSNQSFYLDHYIIDGEKITTYHDPEIPIPLIPIPGGIFFEDCAASEEYNSLNHPDANDCLIARISGYSNFYNIEYKDQGTYFKPIQSLSATLADDPFDFDYIAKPLGFYFDGNIPHNVHYEIDADQQSFSVWPAYNPNHILVYYTYQKTFDRIIEQATNPASNGSLYIEELRSLNVTDVYHTVPISYEEAIANERTKTQISTNQQLQDIIDNVNAIANIEKHSNSTYKLYPNPVNSILNIDSKTPIEVIHIYNLLGEELLSVNAPNKIDLSSLPPANYMAEIVFEDKTILKTIVKN